MTGKTVCIFIEPFHDAIHSLLGPNAASQGGDFRTSKLLKLPVAAQVTWLILLVVFFGPITPKIMAADLSGAAVKEAIEQGKKFLTTQQGRDGSWSVGNNDLTIGITSMALLALINSGMTTQEPPVKRGLNYLRGQRPEELGLNSETYQISLMIMAFAAAKDGKDGKTDAPRISQLAARLEKGQVTQGSSPGGWSYRLGDRLVEGGGDPSNSQFAVLGLREAVEMGATVSRETWQRSRDYWERAQNGDGGWSYGNIGGGAGSKGSMTVAGVASLAICEQMLRSDTGVGADGTPPCCQTDEPNLPLERGISWLGQHLAMGHNPGGDHGWLLYYIYGVERAGRLSGRRFFGNHDWYREGAERLVALQMNGGSWIGTGLVEDQPVLGTSLALLFLSKGMAPVLVNKLKYGPQAKPGDPPSNDWNRHRRDVRNLTELISGLPKWPKLLTSQDLDITRAAASGRKNGLDALLQAPVLFITGEKSPELKPEEIELLKDYLQEGKFIFAAPTCSSREFESGFRELVRQIMPPGEGELKQLAPDHPVFRSEYPLDPSTQLLGVDYGCRTPIIYSPDDLGCLWNYWARQDPPNRNINLKTRIIKATNIGVNVMAYATGREPPAKTDVPQATAKNVELDKIERGLLQIAQIRHDGAWNAAPRALRNLLLALNETSAMAASTKSTDLLMTDPNLFQFPIVYMHGRNRFSISPDDRQQVRKYLERGGVLFADSCCGAKPFDKAFRDFANSLYPDKKLERIQVDHELFSEKIGHDIRKLKRRTNEGNEGGNSLVRDAEPLIEGIFVDGRLAVIYSKYDISCALERQSIGNCEGYLPEDAVKLATNIVLYSLAQELKLAPTAGGN